MARKPRIPDPLTLIYCIACRRNTNGRGWHGPGCMCEVPDKMPPSHSIGVRG